MRPLRAVSSSLCRTVGLPANLWIQRESLLIWCNRIQALPDWLEWLWCAPGQFIVAKPQPNEMPPEYTTGIQHTTRQRFEPGAYVCSSLSLNASLAWSSPRLLIYWMSPFWKFSPREYFSAKKCTASSASACASEIGGICALRFCRPYPVKWRR